MSEQFLNGLLVGCVISVFFQLIEIFLCIIDKLLDN